MPIDDGGMRAGRAYNNATTIAAEAFGFPPDHRGTPKAAYIRTIGAIRDKFDLSGVKLDISSEQRDSLAELLAEANEANDALSAVVADAENDVSWWMEEVERVETELLEMKHRLADAELRAQRAGSGEQSARTELGVAVNTSEGLAKRVRALEQEIVSLQESKRAAPDAAHQAPTPRLAFPRNLLARPAKFRAAPHSHPKH